jgi:hypothetical protein
MSNLSIETMSLYQTSSLRISIYRSNAVSQPPLEPNSAYRNGTLGMCRGVLPLAEGVLRERSRSFSAARTDQPSGRTGTHRPRSVSIYTGRVVITVPKPRPASSEKLPARGRRRRYKSATEAPRPTKSSRLDPQNRDVGSWPAT